MNSHLNKKNSHSTRKGPLAALGCLTVALLLGWHFFQIISFSRDEIALKDYQQKAAEFSESNKSLEIRLSQSGSYQKVGSLVREMNFERADKIHYIRVLDGSVATNK